MTQYVSRYIPPYDSIIEPLRRLTRQDPSWTWSKTQQPAFDDLKDALSASHVMVFFDRNTLIEVIVDTFLVGVSAM